MGEDYLDVQWDDVEDETDVIEAHLHLLLDGRDRLAVGHALGRYIRKTFPGLDILRADRLFQPDNLKDLGHGPGYVMEQSKLNQWKTDGV